MNNNVKNTEITIKPELAELNGYVIFAEKIAKATKMVANLDEAKLEKLRKEANAKQA